MAGPSARHPLLGHCTAYYTQTADASTLSPAQVAAEIDWIKQAMSAEAVYGDSLSKIGRQPEFGPIPGWWQMLPFFKVEDYYKWVAAHPEVAARSDADINATKAHAGLPADTPDMHSLIGLKSTPAGSAEKH
jgi:hypothetical protein